MLTSTEKEQFIIFCQTHFPEYILREPNDDDLLGLIMSMGQNRNLFVRLYKYDDDDINFVLGRLHYEINNVFNEISGRIEKQNRYVLSNQRVEINTIKRVGFIFQVSSIYMDYINFLTEFIENDDTRKYLLPDDYVLSKTILYEPIFTLTSFLQFNKAKYLIFGVSTKKPDLRIKDVMDGNIEVDNYDDVLVRSEEHTSELQSPA